ncbi:MAG: alpha/beta fold hydrolase [Gammaproteobacteria bacterium]|nr:alpha/beta fold hydrolase [Gammaproteobacteria bacterium]
MTAQLLHYSRLGSGEPLVVLHGLFGSSKNWQSLAKLFGENFSVYSVDLRNHGSSFHNSVMNYAAMAEDVERLLDHLNIQSCRIIGHSMGGKVAMILAHARPDLISRLVIADIAPVAYQHHHDELLKPIMAISLDDIGSRTEVDQALATSIPDPMLRGFLLQNLVREGDSWRWRVNWAAIKQNMDELIGFLLGESDWSISTPALFIRGENSDYIDAKGVAVIEYHFDNARIETLARAGHWLHAEQPKAFLQSALDFLN